MSGRRQSVLFAAPVFVPKEEPTDPNPRSRPNPASPPKANPAAAPVKKRTINTLRR